MLKRLFVKLWGQLWKSQHSRARGVSREGSVGLRMIAHVVVSMACFEAQPGWVNLRFCMHGYPPNPDATPSATPRSLPLSSPQSITPPPNGQYGCLSRNPHRGREEWGRTHWPVSGHVVTGSVYRPVHVCFCSSLEMLYPSPYFTVTPNDNLFQPLFSDPITV